ncbi:MAG: hypothetical protein Q4B50_01535 [Bacillota bacterium]|nr:hypothetical protein [Bacillota bacterium]
MPKYFMDPVPPGYGAPVNFDQMQLAHWNNDMQIILADVGWGTLDNAVNAQALYRINSEGRVERFVTAQGESAMGEIARSAAEGRLFVRPANSNGSIQLRAVVNESGFPEAGKTVPMSEVPRRNMAEPERPAFWKFIVAFFFSDSESAKEVNAFRAERAAYEEDRALADPALNASFSQGFMNLMEDEPVWTNQPEMQQGMGMQQQGFVQGFNQPGFSQNIQQTVTQSSDGFGQTIQQTVIQSSSGFVQNFDPMGNMYENMMPQQPQPNVFGGPDPEVQQLLNSDPSINRQMEKLQNFIKNDVLEDNPYLGDDSDPLVQERNFTGSCAVEEEYAKVQKMKLELMEALAAGRPIDDLEGKLGRILLGNQLAIQVVAHNQYCEEQGVQQVNPLYVMAGTCGFSLEAAGKMVGQSETVQEMVKMRPAQLLKLLANPVEMGRRAKAVGQVSDIGREANKFLSMSQQNSMAAPAPMAPPPSHTTRSSFMV